MSFYSLLSNTNRPPTQKPDNPFTNKQPSVPRQFVAESALVLERPLFPLHHRWKSIHKIDALKKKTKKSLDMKYASAVKSATSVNVNGSGPLFCRPLPSNGVPVVGHILN